MAKYQLLLLAVGCIAIFGLIDAARPKKPQFRRRPGYRGPKSKDDDDLVSVKNDIDDLRAELDEMKSQCGVSKVQFSFHGHGDEPVYHGPDKDDVRVHVDLHLDDDHHYSHGDGDNHDHVHTARCQFSSGYARIVQNVPKDEFADFKFSFNSIKSDVLNLHVHQNGDLSNGCKGLGGHYDPIDPNRDVGDVGSLRPDSDDIRGGVWFNNTKLTLIGHHSIIGRSIIGHDGDNNIVTCCVIGRAADDHDHDADHEDHGSHGHDHDSHDHDAHDDPDHDSHSHHHEDHVHH